MSQPNSLRNCTRDGLPRLRHAQLPGTYNDFEWDTNKGCTNVLNGPCKQTSSGTFPPAAVKGPPMFALDAVRIALMGSFKPLQTAKVKTECTHNWTPMKAKIHGAAVSTSKTPPHDAPIVTKNNIVRVLPNPSQPEPAETKSSVKTNNGLGKENTQTNTDSTANFK